MLEIRRLGPDEEADVQAAEKLFDDPVDLDGTRRFLSDDGNVLLVAYVDGDPAGFVTGTELSHPDKAQPELFLNELAVDEAYRGGGIGRRLVAQLWELAQARRCRGMWVLTDDDNEAANKVYSVAGGMRLRPVVMCQWGES